MGWYTGRRTQTVVWWSSGGLDRYGDPVRGPASEILVRWERTRRDMMDPTGARVAVDVMVTYGPDDDVHVDDTFFLGELEDLYGTGAGTAQVSGAEFYRVKALDFVPTLDGGDAYREAGLVRVGGTLP
jgi:hypothetical protein